MKQDFQYVIVTAMGVLYDVMVQVLSMIHPRFQVILLSKPPTPVPSVTWASVSSASKVGELALKFCAKLWRSVGLT